MAISRNVFEIFDVKKYNDFENCVTGHSRSSKVTPFDSLHLVSYYRPVATLWLKCTIFEIWRHWSKSAEKTNALSFGTFLGGDSLRIFRRVIPCQKLKSWGYQTVTFRDPVFALLGTIPAFGRRRVRQTAGQTDGHVALAKTALYA